MENKYPKDNEIKVVWNKIHISIILISTFFLIGFILFELLSNSIKLQKIFTVVGLYIDIIGVTVASLKTPYYGMFHDGGQIEIKRQNKEKYYFQFGMYLIACGMIVQGISYFFNS